MKLRTLILSGLILATTSCAAKKTKTISDIPEINTEKIQMAAFPFSGNTEIQLTLLDERAPQFKKNSSAVLEELERAVSDLLNKQGLRLQKNAGNKLTLSVSDHQSGRYQEGCVNLAATFEVQKKGKVSSKSNACMEYTHVLGRLRSDINSAYEMALESLFKEMRIGLETLYQ